MKKIIIALLLLVVFCMASWAQYAGNLDVQRVRVLEGAIWVEFDRVPWGGRYTYYGFHCIIKQENTDSVLYKGMIVRSSGKELALELEEKGYDWLKEHAELNK